MLLNVRERCHLASSFVERFDRNGDAENVGKLGLDAATVGSNDCIDFVESAPGEECRSDTMFDGNVEVVPRERFDDRDIGVRRPARLRTP